MEPHLTKSGSAIDPSRTASLLQMSTTEGTTTSGTHDGSTTEDTGTASSTADEGTASKSAPSRDADEDSLSSITESSDEGTSDTGLTENQNRLLYLLSIYTHVAQTEEDKEEWVRKPALMVLIYEAVVAQAREMLCCALPGALLLLLSSRCSRSGSSCCSR